MCNLVLGIVAEDEVKRIINKIKNSLNDQGLAFIGFCNPELFNVSETNHYLRPVSRHSCNENHSYVKTKKEGGFQILENYQPIDWYKKVFNESGLTITDVFFTPEYGLNGRKIKEFIIFKLTK